MRQVQGTNVVPVTSIWSALLPAESRRQRQVTQEQKIGRFTNVTRACSAITEKRCDAICLGLTEEIGLRMRIHAILVFRFNKVTGL